LIAPALVPNRADIRSLGNTGYSDGRSSRPNRLRSRPDGVWRAGMEFVRVRTVRGGIDHFPAEVNGTDSSSDRSRASLLTSIRMRTGAVRTCRALFGAPRDHPNLNPCRSDRPDSRSTGKRVKQRHSLHRTGGSGSGPNSPRSRSDGPEMEKNGEPRRPVEPGLRPPPITCGRPGSAARWSPPRRPPARPARCRCGACGSSRPRSSPCRPPRSPCRARSRSRGTGRASAR